MNPPKQYIAKLADKHVLNSKYTQLFFELAQPHLMEFSAGQYASVALPEGGYRRSYSLCSTPETTHGFEFLLDLAPNGIGVQYLNSLQFGQEMSLLAPLGFFTVSEVAKTSPLVLLATGSGIAPFRSMLLDQLQLQHNQQPIFLYWGLRYVEELFWQDEFEELATTFPNFHFHPVISRAIPEWPLCRGRVTDCLLVHELPPDAHYFLCGNTNMIQDVMAMLTQKGITEERIHHEKFY